MDRVALQPLPPREALAYFRSKGYAPALQRFDYRDHTQEEHARGFVVAKAMQDDTLETIRSAVDTALAEGQTLQSFQQEVEPKLVAQGWWGKGIERDPLTGELKQVELGSMRRLKVIFDTNLRTAYAAGQWARLQRTKAFLPYLEYSQLKRDTAREEHMPFDGIILPIDHPIWRKIFPPNGWFCACSVRPMNDRMLEREGKSVTTDEELAALASAPWTNPRTGQTEDLLDGIDPSFASNPGAAWQDTDDRHAASQLDLPDEFRAYDRGYVKETGALGLRDNRNVALAYDLRDAPDAMPLMMTRGAADDSTPAPLSADTVGALQNRDASLVLVRAQTDMPVMQINDLETMATSPGLAQIAMTSPDGSIFRASRAAGTGSMETDALRSAFDFARLSVRDDPRTVGMTDAEIEMVGMHALLRALSDRGDVQYAAAPSGSVAALFARASEVIAELVVALARR